jgi:uncharacterized RDD family membrane protein YckC
MGKGRAPPVRRSHCPVCDATLDATLAEASAPRCSQCGQSLVPIRVAGMWRRLAAFAIDGAALLCTAGLLNWALLAMIDPAPLLGGARGIGAVLALLEVPVWSVVLRIAPTLVMAALYFGIFWTLKGQTLGQRVLRIRVVDPQGRRPHPARVAVRLLGQVLALPPAALGWIWVAFDREKQGLHDHLARTWVVRDA